MHGKLQLLVSHNYVLKYTARHALYSDHVNNVFCAFAAQVRAARYNLQDCVLIITRIRLSDWFARGVQRRACTDMIFCCNELT